MRNAVYFVVDRNYFDLAIIQAHNISSSFGYDVHIFLEYCDEAQTPVSAGADRVFVHLNELAKFLPDGLPSDSQWPPVVYLRVFAPRLLRTYDRVIYLDADVTVLASPQPIFTLPMHGKAVAAVLDSAVLRPMAPGFDIPVADWLNRIGVAGHRYFNSGVLMIDVGRWVEIDFAGCLTSYFAVFSTHARMWDQDFLNWLFQNDWLELSPRWNFQIPIFNFGFEEHFQPAFVHFADERKPWHGASFDIDPRFVAHYCKLAAAAGVDVGTLPKPRPTRVRQRVRPFKAILRRLQACVGIRSRKERRVRENWRQMRELYVEKFSECSRSGAYADQGARSFIPAPVDVVFNGRIMVARQKSPVAARPVSALRTKPIGMAALGS